jgi:hypothetical protein
MQDKPRRFKCIKEYKSSTFPNTNFGVVGKTYAQCDGNDDDPIFISLVGIGFIMGSGKWCFVDRYRFVEVFETPKRTKESYEAEIAFLRGTLHKIRETAPDRYNPDEDVWVLRDMASVSLRQNFKGQNYNPITKPMGTKL